MMEAVNGGRDLHVSVTMPSIEVCARFFTALCFQMLILHSAA
jgi:hypothetical protein